MVHEDSTILQGNFGPLVITLNAEPNSEVTKLSEILGELKQLLLPTKEVIAREIDNW